MTLDEILERRLERVRLPSWAPESYIKIDYLDDEVSPMCSLVMPKAQTTLNREVGIRMPLKDAFANKNDWEEYNGTKHVRF